MGFVRVSEYWSSLMEPDMKELSLRVGFTVPERFGAGMECDSKANSAEEKSGAKDW